MKTAFVATLYLCLAIAFARATPLLEASDEARHFAVSLLIKQQQSLPRADLNERTIALQQVTQAPLYYLITAAIIYPFDTSQAGPYFEMRPGFIVGRADLPGAKNMFIARSKLPERSLGTEAAVWSVRLFSVLLGLGVVLCTLYSMRSLLPEPAGTEYFAAALAAFNPMFLFIHSSVNNDCLLNFLSALLVYFVVRTRKQPVDFRWAIKAGAIAGAAVLSKLSGLALLVPLLVYLMLKSESLPRFVRNGGALLAAAAAVSAWWFLRNWLLYESLTATGIHSALAGNRRSEFSAFALLQEWDGFVKSFWGVFGGFNIIYPDAAYLGFYILSALLLALVAISQFVRATDDWRRTGIFLLTMFCTNIAAVAAWTSVLLGSQGRLLFLSLPAVGVLSVGGSLALGPCWRNVFYRTVVLTLIGCSAWAALWIIPGSYEY